MTRKTCLALMLVLTMVGVQVGCATQSVSFDYSPKELGKIGARIHETPEKKDTILSENDLTEEEFRQAVRGISEDPALSKKYREGFQSVQSDS